MDLNNILITDKNAVTMLKKTRVLDHISFHLANTKRRPGIVTLLFIDSLQITSVRKSVWMTIYDSLWLGTQKSVLCPYNRYPHKAG